MESGDGLIVRVKPRAGCLQVGTLRALADAAQRCGNGQLELTRRANVQLRGVRQETLPELLHVLAVRGLLDANPGAEAIRNILVSPLAGCDPTEVLDVRPLALDLERQVEADSSLGGLPGKFAFVIDGGGALPLDAERADVRLRAITVGATAQIAVGIDRPGGTDWLGWARPWAAPAAAIGAARAFIEVRRTDGKVRLRDLAESGVEAIRTAVSRLVDPLEIPLPPRRRFSPVGLLKDGTHVFAVGLGVPFGRVDSEPVRALAEVLAAAGAAELRLSPWRIAYVPMRRGASADTVLSGAAALGFIVDGNDPLLKVSACPGAPACCSTLADTRRDARLLAAAIAAFSDIRSVHVSGCPKGCARSEPADLVIVAQDNGYGVIRNGTASDPPEKTISFAELSRLPALVNGRQEAPHA
jgi:precorrin-3B synthase